MTKYVICMGVQNSAKEHITLCFLGERNDIEIEEIQMFLQSLKIHENRPSIKIIGEDLFGPNKNMPVWLIQLTDKKYKEPIQKLFTKYNVEQEHTKGITFPNLHITKTANERHIDDILKLDSVYIKIVGGDIIFKI